MLPVLIGCAFVAIFIVVAVFADTAVEAADVAIKSVIVVPISGFDDAAAAAAADAAAATVVVFASDWLSGLNNI